MKWLSWPTTPAWVWRAVSDSLSLFSHEDALTIFSDFFTKNIDRTWRLLENLEAGMIGMNTGNSSAAETPFGGIKESGYGKESGKDVAVAEYMVRMEPYHKLVIAMLTKQFLDHQDWYAHLVRPLLSNEYRSCGLLEYVREAISIARIHSCSAIKSGSCRCTSLRCRLCCCSRWSSFHIHLL